VVVGDEQLDGIRKGLVVQQQARVDVAVRRDDRGVRDLRIQLARDPAAVLTLGEEAVGIER
jgi:hypothetical protein